MIIEIDERWKVTVDTYGNHEPVEFREVENRKTKELSMKWVEHNKYFPNMVQALRYIIDQTVLEKVDVATYREYIEQYKSLIDYFESKLSVVQV